MTKLLKLTMLLFISSIIFTLNSCSKNDTAIQTINPNSINEISTLLQSKFNKEDFNKTLPYNYNINWHKPVKRYSKELKTFYYEFPIYYNTAFNPNNTINKHQNINGYRILFKVFVTVDIKKGYRFYISKYYKKVIPLTNAILSKQDLSMTNSTFTGFMHLIDKDDDVVFAEKINKGITDEKLFFDKAFKNKAIANKMIEDCSTYRINNYIDWYKITTNSDGTQDIVFSSSQLINVTYQTICYTYFIPGGGGGFANTGEGGPSPYDCGDPIHGCIDEVKDMIDNTDIPVISDVNEEDIYQGIPLNFNTLTLKQKVSVVVKAIKKSVSDNNINYFDINELFYNLPTVDVDVVAKININGNLLDVRIIFGVYSNLQINDYPNNTSQFGPLSGKVGNYVINGYWWTMKFRSYGAKYGNGADALWLTVKQKGQYNFDNSNYFMNYLGY